MHYVSTYTSLWPVAAAPVLHCPSTSEGHMAALLCCVCLPGASAVLKSRVHMFLTVLGCYVLQVFYHSHHCKCASQGDKLTHKHSTQAHT